MGNYLRIKMKTEETTIGRERREGEREKDGEGG